MAAEQSQGEGMSMSDGFTGGKLFDTVFTRG